MPPNPSKMAPIQMQSSPVRRKSRDTTAHASGSSNSSNRMRDKTKLVQNSAQGNVQSNKRTKTPEFKVGSNQNYTGRKSTSPDCGSNYAGAKFSEAPTPDCLPMPPAHWVQSLIKPRAAGRKEFSISEPSHFNKIAMDLKMMLKVEA